jgi:universal stress protein A
MGDHAPIVLPTDFSEFSLAAVPWVRRMAAALSAQVHCIYVVEEPQIYATLDIGPVPLPSATELVATATNRLHGLVAERLADLPSPPVCEVVMGRAADEIVSYAKSVNAGMIVLATHGYSGVRHMLLGSTTEAVLRQASCPVLSIRTDARMS